ncbi:MAG TPA: hypothetical protein VGV68_01115 [Terriglobia bacterium]|nr:hypothetical protein [Terriglobia bacterium]
MRKFLSFLLFFFLTIAAVAEPAGNQPTSVARSRGALSRTSASAALPAQNPAPAARPAESAAAAARALINPGYRGDWGKVVG